MTHEELIAEIIRILNLPGEENTDGECLDLVASCLEDNGYVVYADNRAPSFMEMYIDSIEEERARDRA